MNDRPLMRCSIVLFFILLSLSPNAQTPKNSNHIGLVKDINIAAFTGKKYRITADIQCNFADSSTQWGLSALQVGKGDYDFIEGSGRNLLYNTKSSGWKKCLAEGILSPGSKRIWIYLVASGNGDFYFDNLSLSVEEDDGWKTIPIDNSDFEQTTDISKVLKLFKNTKPVKNNPNATASISSLDENNKALHLSLRNNTVSYQVFYGHNRSSGKYVTLKDGKKLYYETYGEGAPLLLLHGNGGSISSFEHTIPELAKHYKVIAVDTRGQGNSTDNETTEFNYDLFADDMETLIRQLGLKHINIVGWSDGAIIGLLLSIRHPELTDKLMLMGVNLNPSAEAISQKILQQARRDIKKLKGKNDPGNITKTRLLEMLLQYPDIAVAELSKVKAKTLVMAGAKDLVLEAHTRLIAENIPNARLNIVKGETHFLPQENPKLFNKIVLEFLLEN